MKIQTIITATLALALAFAFNACDSGGDGGDGKCTAAYNTEEQYCSNGVMKTYGSFYDGRDDYNQRTYKTVEIGDQTWMAENLEYRLYSDIYSCYNCNIRCYGDDAANCKKYGLLYNWYAAMKACPSGWHIPSHEEWVALEEAVGGSSTLGRYLKAASGWNDYNGNSGNGYDYYGFSALPGGYRDSDGTFDGVGDYGCWWSSTEIPINDYAIAIGMSYDDKYYCDLSKFNFLSVRCVKD
jgi:uncharacterized protein (TIGR02145 family)